MTDALRAAHDAARTEAGSTRRGSLTQTTTTLRLRTGTVLDASPAGDWATLSLIPRRVRLKLGTSKLLPALELLAEAAATELQLANAVSRDDRQALRSWAQLVNGLRTGNWLEQSIADQHGPLVTLKPVSTLANAGSASLGQETLVVASRFTAVRRDGDAVVAESPRAGAVAVLHDHRVGALFAALGVPMRQSELVELMRDSLDAGQVRSIVRVLVQGRLLLIAGGGEEDAPAAMGGEPHDGAAPGESSTGAQLWLDQWSPADLYFHSRSRMGRHANPYGGTYRFIGRHEPLPAVRPRRADASVVALEQPDLAAVAAHDPSLTTVLEERASRRLHDDTHPIGLGQLSEFLYRAQRIRWVHDTGERGEVTSRPYPSGGSLYELEVYPVVHRCAGLDAGVYRYDGQAHALEPVAATGVATRDLLEIAQLTSLMDAPPQVLLVIAARFGRIMWKYESVGYAVILKNVGALYQTMYLVATAMGLAACALGGGDSELFARATGLRFEEESSVGEFILVSRSSSSGRRNTPTEWSAP
jgi:SagB-type dehydrogenase family enzyme